MGDRQLERPSETRDLGSVPSAPRREDFKGANKTHTVTSDKIVQNGTVCDKKPIPRRKWNLKNPFAAKTRPLESDTPAKESNGSAKLKQPESNGEIQPVSRTKSEKLWPNPEQSLGDKCDTLVSSETRSKFQCWQTVGEASELTGELLTKILKFLFEYSVEIHREGGGDG